MKEVLMYIGIFVIAYLFYLIFVLSRKKVLSKFIDSKEVKYLKYKYKIKVDEKNIKKIANLIFLTNSFILTITVFIVSIFDNFILGLIVSVIPLVILILTFYHLIGTYYRKKQGG